MDNLIIYGSIGIVILMVIGGFVMVKDQTAPIGRPKPKKIPSEGSTQILSSGLTQGQESEIRQLVSRGQNFEAIKLLRQITNVGLKEAKEAIDEVAAGRPLVLAPFEQKINGGDETIKALILQGRKIEAIKELREQTGLGLAEAKAEVERIERTLG